MSADKHKNRRKSEETARVIVREVSSLQWRKRVFLWDRWT